MHVAPKGASVYQSDVGCQFKARLIRSSEGVPNCADSKREPSLRLYWLTQPWRDPPILFCTVPRLMFPRSGNRLVVFRLCIHKRLLHGRTFGWAPWCQNVGPSGLLRVTSSSARSTL